MLPPIRLWGNVTPLVGVWIEIFIVKAKRKYFVSLPLWECGLKYELSAKIVDRDDVTPLVGVWIEIKVVGSFSKGDFSHSPCGSVD